MNLWEATTEDFLQLMKEAGTERAYVVTEARSGAVVGSHSFLESVVEAIQADQRDYHGHEGMFFEVGAASGHLLGAFVHLTIRGQAAGGVRFWQYATVEDYLRDGLRLSRGMGHKCALAGLWWGGGKGVIARRPQEDHTAPALRRAVYQDYGRFISGICGCYVTAEDAGTTPPDMARVFETTRHTTCIPQAFGGSGNPSVLTARGVVVGMEAALEYLQKGTLEGKTVALQGAGNVSFFMIGDLLQRKVKRIVAADIEEAHLEKVRRAYPDAPLALRHVSAEDMSILHEPCDVVAPNAIGATLNSQTIPQIQAPVVCGAANNQLEDSRRDGKLLQEQGVLYVPDFLANRMGIVNCANEQYGVIANDPAITSHLEREAPAGIFQRSLEIFRRAQESGRTTAEEAERLADELSLQPNPLWGNRGQVIIDYLVASGWAQGQPTLQE